MYNYWKRPMMQKLFNDAVTQIRMRNRKFPADPVIVVVSDDI